MKYLNNHYTPVCNHKGLDICTLKTAVPADGDELGYRIDSEEFKDCIYKFPADAIIAINNFFDKK